VQDYKSLRAAVMTHDVRTNTQTDRQLLISLSLYEKFANETKELVFRRSHPTKFRVLYTAIVV